MAQPSFEEEHPDVTAFQRVHRMVYLPLMHFLFSVVIIGIIASACGLIRRWNEFKRKPFSPAHAAFCCPTLSHANAIQAYRDALNSFSGFRAHHPYLIFLYIYWVAILSIGTVLALTISSKFFASLPAWTQFDIDDDVEPPAPNETDMTKLNMISAGETLVQRFISPAILQANETGALVLTRDKSGRTRKYRRTRKVTALGFEPIMDTISIGYERDILMEWVGMLSPRARLRTLSVPVVDFSYTIGVGNPGVLGAAFNYPSSSRH
jgi:hypothetical protein